MRGQTGPVLGWRLWRVRDGNLWSWGIDSVWQPGDGRAVCLRRDVETRCAVSPGISCPCGFWALRDLAGCVAKARKERLFLDDSMQPVIGLMLGWGLVALHGAEGFRTQYARPLCLFEDWIWDPELDLLTKGRLRWWRHLDGRSYLTSSEAHERHGVLRRAADRHGVPLVTLRRALQFGVLRELGVAGELVAPLEQRLKRAS